LFQEFGHEVEHLTSAYAPPPTGAFPLAEETGVYVGCIGLRQVCEGIGEIKRLYASPVGRGRKKILVSLPVSLPREIFSCRFTGVSLCENSWLSERSKDGTAADW